MLNISEPILWLAGAVLAIGGVVGLGSDHQVAFSLCSLLAGLMLLPWAHRRIRHALNRDIPQIGFLIIAALLFLAGGALSGISPQLEEVDQSAAPADAPTTVQPAPLTAEQIKQQQFKAALKVAQAPAYLPAQTEQNILHKVQRDPADANIIYQISVEHVAQSEDCDRIVGGNISPNSTPTNLVMVVSCANKMTYTIHEKQLPSEQQ